MRLAVCALVLAIIGCTGEGQQAGTAGAKTGGTTASDTLAGFGTRTNTATGTDPSEVDTRNNATAPKTYDVKWSKSDTSEFSATCIKSIPSLASEYRKRYCECLAAYISAEAKYPDFMKEPNTYFAQATQEKVLSRCTGEALAGPGGKQGAKGKWTTKEKDFFADACEKNLNKGGGSGADCACVLKKLEKTDDFVDAYYVISAANDRSSAADIIEDCAK